MDKGFFRLSVIWMSLVFAAILASVFMTTRVDHRRIATEAATERMKITQPCRGMKKNPSALK